MTKAIFNGEIVNRDEIKIDFEDRGYQFGDGIYEVAAIYNGESFRMKEHLRRLERSANEIKLNIGKTIEEIEDQLEELISLNKVKNGIIYMQVSRGVAPRVHHFPSTETPPTTIAYTTEVERPLEVQKKGVSCLIVEDIRWMRCDIKTLNLLGNAMARQKAVENGYFEAIFKRGDTITEGAGTNLFIVKNGELYTHPANNFILNGITRRTVIEICKNESIRVNEETFNEQKLLEADEVFLAGTYLDIVPIIKIHDTIIGSGQPGPVTISLQEKYNALIEM